MNILEITIPGPAVPLERARHTKTGRMYTPPRSVAYQRHVKSCATLAVLRAPWWRLHHRYIVGIDYWPQDRSRRDISNVTKSLEDAMNGVVWDDDFQIDQLFVTRHWDGSAPRVVVSVCPILPMTDAPMAGSPQPSPHKPPRTRPRRQDTRNT